MRNSILLGLVLGLSFNAYAASSKVKTVNDKQKFAISNEGRGGGDDVALEFQSALISAIEESKSHPQLAKVLKDNNILDNSAKARIVIVDDALDVKVRDLVQTSVAVNIPAEQKILINRQRWNDIQDQRIRSAIALHEALSLKNIEQTGYYPYSTKYLTLVGVSANSLSSALKVNRFQQIQATTGTKDPGVILKKFFEEAREPVTAGEIGKQATKNGESFQCRASTSGNEIFSVDFLAVNIYVNGRQNGPLFPEVRAWRFVLNARDQELFGPESRILASFTVTEKVTEVLQQSSVELPHVLRLRKNNGHITYHLIAEVLPGAGKFESYGYCFTQGTEN